MISRSTGHGGLFELAGSSCKKKVSVALGVSISAHLLLFASLAIIQFAGAQSTASANHVTSAQISRVIQRPAVVSVPKVKPVSTREMFSAGADEFKPETLGTEQTENSIQNVIQASVIEQAPFVEQSAVPVTTEFFSSVTCSRKIVYVVDMSGSMSGLDSRIRRQLKESVAQLRPDNYFYVILFGAGEIYELAQGKLIRATETAKRKACEFIDSYRADGTTNALDALERAMRIKDSSGKAAEQIFFLTDGFEVEGEYRNQFRVHLENIRKSLAPKTRINTIGFWMGQEDKDLLAWIAGESGGVFTNIE